MTFRLTGEVDELAIDDRLPHPATLWLDQNSLGDRALVRDLLHSSRTSLSFQEEVV